MLAAVATTALVTVMLDGFGGEVFGGEAFGGAVEGDGGTKGAIGGDAGGGVSLKAGTEFEGKKTSTFLPLGLLVWRSRLLCSEGCAEAERAAMEHANKRARTSSGHGRRRAAMEDEESLLITTERGRERERDRDTEGFDRLPGDGRPLFLLR